MKKILINASNLHVGGGVQVATSFIMELSRIHNKLAPNEVTIYASSEVNKNLSSIGFDASVFPNYLVLNVKGLESIRPNVARKFRGFDLVYTIFGPSYFLTNIPNHIMGFAQPWIIYPKNDVGKRLSLKIRLLIKCKFAIQWRFFRAAERLVVELEHVQNSLTESKSYPADRIDIVYNCVSEIYFKQELWKEIPGLDDLRSSSIKLGFIGRDYLHKNLNFFIQLSRELGQLSNKKYQIFVTLTEEEWATRSPEFRKYVINIGPLSMAQCPTFYQAMDAVVFPSLLESFSATPLEAMAMRRPLFASDRRFVRDCCGDYALMFDPLDASQAAKKIDNWFSRTDENLRKEHIERAYHYLKSMPGSQERARAYVEIINSQLNLKKI